MARLAEAPQLAIMGDVGDDLRRGWCKLIEVVEFVPPEELGRFEPHVRGHLAGLLPPDFQGLKQQKPRRFGRGF